MRLLEAIIEANSRAGAGDAKAGLHPEEFAESLPLVALTCIDPRLNPLIPEVLGVPEEQFIWLRNAGNIIFDTMSSMMRTLALGCAIKGGREIALIGHTDCLVGKATTMHVTDRFRALGIDRSRLPENLNEFFGLFASERQNVIRGVLGGIKATKQPTTGIRVSKFGAATGLTSGRDGGIALKEVDHVSHPYEKFTVRVVQGPFSAKGDSGAAVLDADRNFVGIVFSGITNETYYLHALPNGQAPPDQNLSKVTIVGL